MILRRLEIGDFGPFAEREFDFRSGTNLVAGPNDSGKTVLARAVSGVLFGMPDPGSFLPENRRERPWASLVLENGQRIVRISRNWLSDEVELEERDALHQPGAHFRGIVPLNGGDEAVRRDYHRRLAALFQLPGEPLPAAGLRFLLGDPEPPSDGLSWGLSEGEPTAAADLEPGGDDPDLDSLRQDYAEGMRYLEWARRRWQELDAERSVDPALQQRLRELGEAREKLEREYARTGLPAVVNEDLAVLLAEAAEIRQELVSLGGQTANLRESLLALPGWPWKKALGLSGVLAAAGFASGWLRPDWALAALAFCAGGALLAWLWAGGRAMALRAERARLKGQGSVLEEQREEVQERQADLDARFEALGLSPSAIAVARMQKSLQHGRELQARMAEVDGAIKELSAGGIPVPANLLGRDELDEAEAKLADLAEKIGHREQGGGRKTAGGEVTPAVDAKPCGMLDPEGERTLYALSDGRCERLLGDAGAGLLVAQGERKVPLARCGEGTRSAVRLALGLSLLRKFQSAGGVPLVLDEPFSGMDRERRKEALQILERQGAGHQVIICSHDETLLKRAARERWHVVSLAGTPAAAEVAEERRADAGQLHLL